jgi:hypothetical protein
MKALLAVGAIGLVLLWMALPDGAKGVIVLVIALSIGFFGWRNSVRRRQLVSGTPTSKIATAAKGYAELRGIARNALSVPLRDPITHEECVWFHVETEKFDIGKWRWRTVSSAKSERPFALEDDSGLCLVLPHEARLLTTEPFRVRESLMLRHNVRRIVESEPLYALGHLERLDDAPAKGPSVAPPSRYSPEFERRVAVLMGEWKRDPTERRRIFDPNNDGTTDEAEMAAARELARSEVALRHAGTPSAVPALAGRRRAAARGQRYAVGGREVTHWMRAPDDERDYILSAGPESNVLAHERRAGRGYLLVFVCVAIVSLLLLASWAGVLAP